MGVETSNQEQFGVNEALGQLLELVPDMDKGQRNKWRTLGSEAILAEVKRLDRNERSAQTRAATKKAAVAAEKKEVAAEKKAATAKKATKPPVTKEKKDADTTAAASNADPTGELASTYQ